MYSLLRKDLALWEDELITNKGCNVWPSSWSLLNILCLTHWGRVTHICLSNITIIGSDNGLSPGRRQGITWTYVGILLNGPLGTNFNEISIGIQTFSFKKMHFKMSSAKWRPFCLGLNVLRASIWYLIQVHGTLLPHSIQHCYFWSGIS